jgi:PAS domain S-box-containing protein
LLPSGKFPRIALVVTAVVAILLVVNVLYVPPQSSLLLNSNLLDLAMVSWAAVCSFQVARRSTGYSRQLWLLLGIALTLHASADAISTYYQRFVPNSAPMPWPSQVLFFIWFAPLVVTLLPTPREATDEIDWQRALDFVQIAIVTLTAYAYFFYVPSLGKTDGALMAQRIPRLYLARDTVLCAAFLIRARTALAGRLRTFFAGLSVMFFAEAISDLAYLLASRVSNRTAIWADVVEATPYMFVVLFASLWKPVPDEPATDHQPSRRAVIISQGLTVCIPLLVVLMGYRIAREQITIAGIAVAASFLCSSLRLVLTNRKQHQVAHELRMTEHALRHSEIMFASAFRSSPNAFSICVFPEGRYIDVNDGFVSLTGYSREEAIGKTALELNLWVYLDERDGIMARFAEFGEIREAEFRFRRRSGEVRVGLYSGSVTELDGRICSLVTVRDVTSRKAAEDVLRTSEEHFRSLAQNLHVGILSIGPSGDIQFANQAALDIFGGTSEDVLGKTAIQLGVTPVREDGTDIPFEERPVPLAIISKKPIHNQVFGWRKPTSQSVSWTLLDVVPEYATDGEIIRVLVSLTDITEHKRAEASLRASEERFRTLVRDLNVGVVICGPAGENQYANQSALGMFHLTTAQILGKRGHELGLTPIREDGTEIPPSELPVARALRDRQTVQSEIMGWRNNATNEVVWIFGNAVPQFDALGGIVSVIVSFADVSGLKKAKEELRQLSTRLLKLQDEERRRIGRELHDGLAQSVLAVNLNLAQVRRSTLPLDENSERALDKARDVLHQMSQEIRTLSYLLHPPLLDDLGLASAVKQYAIGFSERSGIATEVELQPDFPRLYQDAETALFRIVQAALANIQRHSGSATARICLQRDSGQVTLEISDRGCGMNGTQPGDGARGSAQLGVGILGMRERVAQLGGHLQIESNPSGTTVKVTIPMSS